MYEFQTLNSTSLVIPGLTPPNAITYLLAFNTNSIFLNWTNPGGNTTATDFSIRRILGNETYPGDGNKD